MAMTLPHQHTLLWRIRKWKKIGKTDYIQTEKMKSRYRGEWVCPLAMYADVQKPEGFSLNSHWAPTEKKHSSKTKIP